MKKCGKKVVKKTGRVNTLVAPAGIPSSGEKKTVRRAK